MAHRIEIELTSRTDETTWTWRAAGAKQPRGTVDASLVPDGTAAGAVLRAEVESTLDGTTVVALLPPKGKTAPRKIETIEVVGVPTSVPDVNVVLSSKSKGRRRYERPGGGRDERPGGGRHERPGGGRDERPGGGRDERPGGGRDERPGGGRDGGRGPSDRRPRTASAERGPRREGGGR